MTGVGRAVVVGSILFTDLVGFTEFTDAVGDVAAIQVLDQQRALVDGELCDEAQARVVKEIGDGLMIWFGSAWSGLGRAVRLLEAFDRTRSTGTFPLPVRMGLHHGESIARGDDLVGHTVNIASRISSLAGPGELLVSEEVVVACGEAGRRIALRPVGPVVVKGVQEAIWLHRFAAS